MILSRRKAQYFSAVEKVYKKNYIRPRFFGCFTVILCVFRAVFCVIFAEKTRFSSLFCTFLRRNYSKIQEKKRVKQYEFYQKNVRFAANPPRFFGRRQTGGRRGESGTIRQKSFRGSFRHRVCASCRGRILRPDCRRERAHGIAAAARKKPVQFTIGAGYFRRVLRGDLSCEKRRYAACVRRKRQPRIRFRPVDFRRGRERKRRLPHCRGGRKLPRGRIRRTGRRTGR